MGEEYKVEPHHTEQYLMLAARNANEEWSEVFPLSKLCSQHSAS